MKLKQMTFKERQFNNHYELVNFVNEKGEILIKGVVEKDGTWYLFYFEESQVYELSKTAKR